MKPGNTSNNWIGQSNRSDVPFKNSNNEKIFHPESFRQILFKTMPTRQTLLLLPPPRLCLLPASGVTAARVISFILLGESSCRSRRIDSIQTGDRSGNRASRSALGVLLFSCIHHQLASHTFTTMFEFSNAASDNRLLVIDNTRYHIIELLHAFNYSSITTVRMSSISLNPPTWWTCSNMQTVHKSFRLSSYPQLHQQYRGVALWGKVIYSAVQTVSRSTLCNSYSVVLSALYYHCCTRVKYYSDYTHTTAVSCILPRTISIDWWSHTKWLKTNCQ